MNKDVDSSDSLIGKVSSYISRGEEAELPVEVIRKAKHHILDTLAAIVSGSELKPGQLAKKYAAMIPLGRLGMPKDLIGTAVFLASDASGYITGQTIFVDGGLTAG